MIWPDEGVGQVSWKEPLREHLGDVNRKIELLECQNLGHQRGDLMAAHAKKPAENLVAPAYVENFIGLLRDDLVAKTEILDAASPQSDAEAASGVAQHESNRHDTQHPEQCNVLTAHGHRAEKHHAGRKEGNRNERIVSSVRDGVYHEIGRQNGDNKEPMAPRKVGPRRAGD